jgi:hypothetical protein
MGAHPKAPSMIIDDGVEPKNLAAWLQANQWALTERYIALIDFVNESQSCPGIRERASVSIQDIVN